MLRGEFVHRRKFNSVREFLIGVIHRDNLRDRDRDTDGLLGGQGRDRRDITPLGVSRFVPLSRPVTERDMSRFVPLCPDTK